MPTFGEFETFGNPYAASDVRSHVSTIWQARKSGAPGEQLYAIKCYATRKRAPGPGQPDEALAQDQRLEFLEGIKQIKKAQSEGGRGLVPIHALGTTPTEAWYVTDFYPRKDLNAWIDRKGEVNGAALRHVVYSVVTACLALKRSRGCSHGNLKPSNIFLAGKPRDLRQTPLLLADAYPAAPLQLASLQPDDRNEAGGLLNQVMEVQDLAAIGKLILQLVEGRLLTRADDYNYPVARSREWDALGKDSNYWLEWCNKLLNPQLSLETLNLETLSTEFRPSATAAKLPKILAVLLGLGLVGWGGFMGVRALLRRGERVRMEAAKQVMAARDLLSVQRQIERVRKWQPSAPEAVILKQAALGKVDSQAKQWLADAARELTATNLPAASNWASKAQVLVPASSEAKGLLERIQQRNADLADQLSRTIQESQNKDLADAKAAFENGDYDKGLRLCEQHKGVGSFDTLQGQIGVEMAIYNGATNQFKVGDYGFLTTPTVTAKASKEPFKGLIEKGNKERSFLNELQELQEKTDWRAVQQRVAEKAVAGFTNKAPFRVLAAWADGKKKEDDSQQRGEGQDLADAKAAFENGDYDKGLRLCAQHKGVGSFDTLQGQIGIEMGIYNGSTNQFKVGDYGFLTNRTVTAKASKEPFKGLIEKGNKERNLLNELQELQRKTDWRAVQQRVAEKAVAGFTNKAPFGDLVMWADGEKKKDDMRQRGEGQDLADAKAAFENGDYDKGLRLCAQHKGVGSFDTLQGQIGIEMGIYNGSTNQFKVGDYGFLTNRTVTAKASKEPFKGLIEKGNKERNLLNELQELQRKTDWRAVQQRVAEKAVAGFTNKAPFGDLVMWADGEKKKDDMRQRGEGQDLADAKAAFESGDYDQGSRLCAQHKGVGSFDTLQGQIGVEMAIYNGATNQFKVGDYGFLTNRAVTAKASKEPFKGLIAEGNKERDLLKDLTRLQGENKWSGVLERLVEQDYRACTNKEPFRGLGTWANQEKRNYDRQEEERKDYAQVTKGFAGGLYREALELCKHHAGMDRFDTLANSIRSEQKALEDETKLFEQGDYSFVEQLKRQSYSGKKPFVELLGKAAKEKQALDELEALKRPDKWGDMKKKLDELGSADFLNKQPFASVKEWYNQNDPLKAKLRDLEVLAIVSGEQKRNDHNLDDPVPTPKRKAIKLLAGESPDPYQTWLNKVETDLKNYPSEWKQREKQIKAIRSALNSLGY